MKSTLHTLHPLLQGRTGPALGAIVSIGLVVLALFIQTRFQLEPCPLCITQRMVFLGLGLLFLLAAVLPRYGNMALVWFVFQGLTAAGGMGVAVRHWWLQAHHGELIADCGVGFDYMFDNFPLQKALRLLFRGTGDCAAIDWTWLGLSLPQLALIAYIGLAGYALVLFSINRQRSCICLR